MTIMFQKACIARRCKYLNVRSCATFWCQWRTRGSRNLLPIKQDTTPKLSYLHPFTVSCIFFAVTLDLIWILAARFGDSTGPKFANRLKRIVAAAPPFIDTTPTGNVEPPLASFHPPFRLSSSSSLRTRSTVYLNNQYVRKDNLHFDSS